MSKNSKIGMDPAEFAEYIRRRFGESAVVTPAPSSKERFPKGALTTFEKSDISSLFWNIAEAQKEGSVAYVSACPIDVEHAVDFGISKEGLYVFKDPGDGQVLKEVLENGVFSVVFFTNDVVASEGSDKLTMREIGEIVRKGETCAVCVGRKNVEKYVAPPESLLKDHVNPRFVNAIENWDDLVDIVESKLKNFGVEAKVIDAIKGPAVTTLTIEMDPGCSVGKLLVAAKDLRRLLRANNEVSIIPQLPGTSYSCIEVPNRERGVVSFKSIVGSKEYREASGDLIVPVGTDVYGNVFVTDIAQMPHALIAGATGSGKSVFINDILSGIIYRYSPEEVKFILIDMKQVELGIYDELPHMLFKNVLSDYDRIVNALKWVRQETENRFVLFKSMKVRNLKEYNERQEEGNRLPRILIVIDEASELMLTPYVRKVIESTLSSLARVARAAGVHIIFATQNPVKEVITNEIQNNLNTKIAFAVGDYNHSLVIFKAKGAECLIGNGDMYIKRGAELRRAQCAYISTEETEAIVEYVRAHNEAVFDEEKIERILNAEIDHSEKSKYQSIRPTEDQEKAYWMALKLCYDVEYISISYLQRKMAKGYNAVATMIEYWEKEGFISKPDGEKKRHFLRSAEEFYELYREKYGEEETPEDDE